MPASSLFSPHVRPPGTSSPLMRLIYLKSKYKNVLKKFKEHVPEKFGEIRLERVGFQEEDRNIRFRRKFGHVLLNTIFQVILILASKFKIIFPECFYQSRLDLFRFEKLRGAKL